MKEDLAQTLREVFGAGVDVQSSRSKGGGCINDTQVLQLTNGEKVFLKINQNPPRDFFSVEAKGLRLLRQAKGGPRVPAPLAVQPGPNSQFILLEYIEEAASTSGFYESFAHSLAAMHRATQDQYGLEHDNFIGKTDQENTPEKNAVTFFRDHRIRFQQELARESGLLPRSADQGLDRLCDRLAELLDVSGERPALVHGDLWSGNYFADQQNRPCIFDPAVYYGLRETDLAMTELFGKLPATFYAAYQADFPLNPGYEERKKIYNLYHLLNHLNLFGSSYLSGVESILKYFTR